MKFEIWNQPILVLVKFICQVSTSSNMSLKRTLDVTSGEEHYTKFLRQAPPTLGQFNAVFRTVPEFQGGFIPIQHNTQNIQYSRCLRCNASKNRCVSICTFCMKQVCDECIQMCGICSLVYCYNCIFINYEQPITTYRCIDCNYDIRNKRK